MTTTSINRTVIISIIGLTMLWGTASAVNAQKKDDHTKQPSQPSQSTQQKTTTLNPARQQVYKQQQTQNQQRYEQRSQKYTQGQQQRIVQKQTVQQVRPGTVQNQTGTQRQLTIQPAQRVGRERQIDSNERVQIQAQQKNWHQSEQTWQSNYNSRWTGQQNTFDQRESELRRQNRREQAAFQQAYWDRVNEDRQRLLGWTFYDDVGLNFSYSRGGRYYYTSEYGRELLIDAINDGYQEGVLAGQSDREDNWQGNYEDSFAYQDASYGYNGYWISLDEYQYYFRQGFQRGYEDGFNGRYQYGTENGGTYSLPDAAVNDIIDFSVISD